MPSSGSTSTLRWRLADQDGAQPRLFEVDEWMPGQGELAGLELLHVRAKRVVNRVPKGARLPFEWTVNAYRGCSHACAYCFARPTHEYLGLDAGSDFERRIVVKVNAVERVRAEVASARWPGERIAMGTNTDPYQVVEARYRLTRGIIEVLLEARNPFSILTKSPLILRDLEPLAHAAERSLVSTALSIPTLDRAAWRLTEPRAPSPHRRLDAVERLNRSGVPCGVLVAPVIPGITDSDEQLSRVVEGALAAGAPSVHAIALHLRPGVREHYLAWLTERDPDLAQWTARRYRGSHAPPEDRRALERRVAALVRRHGGTRPGREPVAPRPAGPPGRGGAQRQLRIPSHGRGPA